MSLACRALKPTCAFFLVWRDARPFKIGAANAVLGLSEARSSGAYEEHKGFYRFSLIAQPDCAAQHRFG